MSRSAAFEDVVCVAGGAWLSGAHPAPWARTALVAVSPGGDRGRVRCYCATGTCCSSTRSSEEPTSGSVRFSECLAFGTPYLW